MASQSLYLEFFGFSERPFTLVPDPSFLYWSDQHKRAYAVLEFGILSRAPITLITGEIGAGKTTLLQALLQRIDESTKVGLVSNAQGDRGELLQWVLHALDVAFDPEASYVSLFQVLQDFLLEEYANGRWVVLIFDEAQNLSKEGLEELRMLTNINSNKDVLVQLILIGQPELRDLIQNPAMQQMAQRVTASFHLGTLDEETVGEYIKYRLRQAGGIGDEFSPEAIARIFQETRGVPRLVNQLSEFALLYAWVEESKTITIEHLDNVIADGVFFSATVPDYSNVTFQKLGQ